MTPTPNAFRNIIEADSLDLILWWHITEDEDVSEALLGEMTHRDIDGDKASECKWLEDNQRQRNCSQEKR